MHLLVASFQAEYAAAAVGNIEKTRKRNNNVGFSGRLVDWAAILWIDYSSVSEYPDDRGASRQHGECE